MVDDLTAMEGGQRSEETNWVRSFSQLGAVLGMTKQGAANLAKLPWFPARDPERGWSIDAVLRAREENAGRSRAATGNRRSSSQASPPPNELIRARRAAEDEQVRLLEEAERDRDRKILATSQDPLEVSRAAMRLASRRLASASEDSFADDLESLKQSLSELRLAENGYLELARARELLIEREVAIACIGKVVRINIQVLQLCEARLAAQLEIWMSDPAFRELAAEERARRARAWMVDLTRAARNEGMQLSESLVAEELADRKADK